MNNEMENDMECPIESTNLAQHLLDLSESNFNLNLANWKIPSKRQRVSSISSTSSSKKNDEVNNSNRFSLLDGASFRPLQHKQKLRKNKVEENQESRKATSEANDAPKIKYPMAKDDNSKEAIVKGANKTGVCGRRQL